MIVRDDGRLLVIKRSRFVRAPGRLCFPGGGIETGESEESAVRRELMEELRLRVVPVRRLWRSEAASGVVLNWWLTRMLPATQEPEPNPSEVEAFYWMEQLQITQRSETLASNRQFLAAVSAGEINLSH